MQFIDNALLVSMDTERRIFKNGAILIEDGVIRAVGRREEVESQIPAGVTVEKLDMSGKMIIPGLIDTHVHLAQAMIRGCADDMALIPWLLDRVWPLQGNYNAKDGQASAALCIAEMLKSGTTSFIEALFAGRYGFEGVAALIEQSGIRACIGKIVMDVGTYAESQRAMHPGMIEDRATTVRDTLRYYDEYNNSANGRLKVWFGPRTPGGCTPELYREISALAKERDMGITVHLAEVKSDPEYIRREYNLSPAEFVAEVGLLDLGPKCVLAHGVWLDDSDIELLAKCGATVSHNPASNTKLASGFARVPEMLAAGVNVGLGCDGGPSNNSYDLIREMKLASIIHKAVKLDPLVVDAETTLEMATLHGAKACGQLEQIGSLEVGKQADLVVIDTDGLGLTPFNTQNPISALVYAASGRDVQSVMIAGKWVVWKGELQTLDEEKLKAEARSQANEVYERAGIKLTSRWPLL